MKRYKRDNLAARLILGFAVVIMASAAIGLDAYFSSAKLADVSARMFDHPLTVGYAVRDIQNNVHAMSRAMRDVALAGDLPEINLTVQRIDELERSVLAKFRIVFDRFLGDPTDVEIARRTFTEWRPIRNDVISLMRAGKTREAADMISGTGAGHVEQLLHDTSSMIVFAGGKAESFKKEADSIQRIVRTRILLTGGAALLFSIFFSFLITRSVTAPLSRIIERIRGISRLQFGSDLEIPASHQIKVLKRSVDEMEKLSKILVLEIEERKKTQEELENHRIHLEDQIRERTEELRGSLQEKEVLLQEIHHRVKNNMQIVSSLLRLHLHSTEDENLQALLEDSQRRIGSMALVHEMLYKSRDFSKIDFAAYLREIVRNLNHSFNGGSKGLSIRVETENRELDIRTAIPCGLIVNELVSNAMKHAFPDTKRGEILVGFRSIADGVCLEVADDGVGIPENIDPEKSATLGLQLVSSLVRQIEGKMTIIRQPGTRVIIEFTPEPSSPSVQPPQASD